MQSEHQYIDDFFRAKEQAFIPDASHMPSHWQQLKAMQSGELLQQFYAQLEKEEQVFTVVSEQDEVVIGKEGTRLRIPPNCFQNKQGIVRGPVQISLQEFYAYEDMIAARLSTRSNDRQLISGGMLRLKATAHGEVLEMAPEKAILVSMPTFLFDGRMLLFTGWVEENGTRAAINWIPAGQQQTKAAAADTTQEAADMRENKAETKIESAAGIILKNKAVIQKIQQQFRSLYHANKLQQVSHDKDQPPQETLPDLPTDQDWKNMTLNERVKWINQYITVKLVPKSQYSFTINSMGWINCDRYMDHAGSTMSVTVHPGEDFDAPVVLPQLVFSRFASIIYGETNGNTIRFDNIPKNVPAHLIIIAVKDGKVVCCMQPLTASTEEITNLSFAPVTPEQFKQQLTTLFASPRTNIFRPGSPPGV